MRLLPESVYVSGSVSAVETDERLDGMKAVDSGNWQIEKEYGLYAPAPKRGVVSTAASAAVSPAEYGLVLGSSSFGFQSPGSVEPVLLRERDDLGLFAVRELPVFCGMIGLEIGGGREKLARWTWVSVVPGSACELLRFGTGNVEDGDTLCRGCEVENDLVVFDRYVEAGWAFGDHPELGSEDDVERP